MAGPRTLPGAPPCIGAMVKVDSDAARRAVALGGARCLPARDIPDVGRFCGLLSAQRVPFYAITYAR